MTAPWNLCCFAQQRRNLKITHVGRQECRQTAASAGEKPPVLCANAANTSGEAKKNSVNWKDIDLAKTVEAHASFGLGDEPVEFRVCLMVPKVSDGGNISLGWGE